MRKHLLWLIIFLTLFDLHGQITFSKRFHFNRSAGILTDVSILSNEGYLIQGIFSDTNSFKTGIISILVDDYGNKIDNHHTLYDPNKTIANFGKTISHEGAVYQAGYVWDSVMRPAVFKNNLESSSGTTVFFEATLPIDSVFIYKFSDIEIQNEMIFATGHIVYRLDYESRVIFRKYDMQANLLATAEYPNPYFRQLGSCITPYNENSFFIGGYRDNLNRANNNFQSQSSIWSVDTLGNLLWQWLSPTGQLQNGIQDMLITEDGGIVIATSIGTEIWVNASSGDLRWDCYIYKLNSDLEQEWGTYFRHNEPSPIHRFNKIIAASDGSGFVAVGQSSSYFPDADPETENVVDIGGIIAKVSPEGDSLWSRIIIHPDLVSFTERHHFYDIEETNDGGFIMVGESTSLDTIPRQQGWLLKVDEWGCLVPGCHLISATEEASEPEIKLLLYPNPAHDVLNVYLGSCSLARGSGWYIYNTIGQEVLHYAANQSNATYVLELDKLPKGQYFLQLKEAGGKTLVQQSFVVQ